MGLTYEYGCTSCKRTIEFVQRINEAPVRICPHCGRETLQRLISSSTTFILKGGGWASDNYASPSTTTPKIDTDKK